MTVEDPVEYQLAGVNQVQVTSARFTFATALRWIFARPRRHHGGRDP